MYVYMHRVAHNFKIRDIVFLRVQPYGPFPLRRGSTQRMRFHLLCPYKLIWRVGEVPYEMELQEGSQIHSILYVSCLEKALGPHVTTFTELPPLDEKGGMILTSEEVLDILEKILRSRVIMEYCIKWRDWPIRHATWESEKVLQHHGLQLLEGNQSREGRTVMSISK
jgi:hypothetical protein